MSLVVGALRSLAAHRARALLTLLGIVIGAGSIVLLASLLAGGKAVLMSSSQDATESDLVRVDRRDPPNSQRSRTRRELSRGDADELNSSRVLDGAMAATEQGHGGEASFEGRE